MKDTKQVVACVFDNPNGLFLPLAQKLSESMDRVYYTTPCEEGFSTINKSVVGKGFEGVIRVRDMWSVKKECDLFVFPDIEHSAKQLELEEQGKAVWGSRTGDIQELDRGLFLRTLKKVGLDVPPYEIVVGITNLKNHLRTRKDKYVKISRYRGSMETWHWRDWTLDRSLLDFYAVKFGPPGEHLEFFVLDNIETPLEVGGDTYSVDGGWPSLMLHGDEHKDKGYIASVMKREEMPEQVQKVLDAFGPIFKSHRYRNQWSMEIRVQGDKSYFIDPTCRGGMPSTGSQLEIWKNFGDIIWYGAHGQLIEPDPAANFTAECVLTLKSEKAQWGTLVVPPALQRWMKLSGCCKVDGVVSFPADEHHGDEIGWLVAQGDTIEGLIETMFAQVEKLPEGVSANTDCLIPLLREIHKGEEQGIEFTDQKVPDPAIVVDNQA